MIGVFTSLSSTFYFNEGFGDFLKIQRAWDQNSSFSNLFIKRRCPPIHFFILKLFKDAFQKRTFSLAGAQYDGLQPSSVLEF